MFTFNVMFNKVTSIVYSFLFFYFNNLLVMYLYFSMVSL